MIAKGLIDEENIEYLILGCIEIPLLLFEEEYYSFSLINTSNRYAQSEIMYYLGRDKMKG